LGREVFSARLTPYLWYKLRFCLDVSAADASTQRSLLLLVDVDNFTSIYLG
jgi:hypothetical protein